MTGALLSYFVTGSVLALTIAVAWRFYTGLVNAS